MGRAGELAAIGASDVRAPCGARLIGVIEWA